jgi:PTH1 family peptidyl-tRNA hydrolase
MDTLIVGLGNPGARYERTRHNLGRRAVESLAEMWGVSLGDVRANARYGIARRGEARIGLAIPITYMNESGRAVAPLARFYRVPAERILVVYDDLDLPLGRLRLRPSGGTGGHRGMASIAAALGTESFPRLRLGIGRPPPAWDATDFVLSPFDDEELAIAENAALEAARALQEVVDNGLVHAMNAYNS